MSTRHSTIKVLMVYAAVFINVMTGSILLGQNEPSSSIFTDSAIILSVSDVRRSVTFYESVLEFKLEYYLIGAAKKVAQLSPSDPEPYAVCLTRGKTEYPFAKECRSSKTNWGSILVPCNGCRRVL
jgi:hypothetical protein